MLFLFFLSIIRFLFFFFFSSRRRHTRLVSDWSSDVCSSDLGVSTQPEGAGREAGGSLLPVPAPLAAKLRAAGRVAPGWYAAAVAALGVLAAVALVGVPAGLGLALLGVALCGLAAALGMAPGAYTLTLWALAAALAAVPALRDADWVWIPCLI